MDILSLISGGLGAGGAGITNQTALIAIGILFLLFILRSVLVTFIYRNLPLVLFALAAAVVYTQSKTGIDSPALGNDSFPKLIANLFQNDTAVALVALFAALVVLPLALRVFVTLLNGTQRIFSPRRATSQPLSPPVQPIVYIVQAPGPLPPAPHQQQLPPR